MPPADDEQRRHEMAASLKSLHPNPTPLNADLFTEILLWLPAKSLIRFKSVCKEWLSLISSDYFCQQHTLRRPKLLLLQHSGWDYFYWNSKSINGGENVMIPYTLSVSPHHYHLVQACNGQLLLTGFNFDSQRIMCSVHNPTTKLSTEINPIYNENDHFVAAMALAFDPSKSCHYKIVCITCSLVHGDTYRIEVYDSESRSWKLCFCVII